MLSRETLDRDPGTGTWHAARRPGLNPADVVVRDPFPALSDGDVAAPGVHFAVEAAFLLAGQEIPQVRDVGADNLFARLGVAAERQPVSAFGDIAHAAENLQVPRISGAPLGAWHDVVYVQSGWPDA